MANVLIKNGLVYDGSGGPPAKQDILVCGERIAQFGIFPKRSADKTIDAAGAIVTPGFIDINTKLDQAFNVFREEYQENFLRQGVTTTIGGNNGMSLAPISSAALYFMKNRLGLSGININWQSVKDFLNHLSRQRLKINYGTLTGHLSLRFLIAGAETRDLTEGELRGLKQALAQSLDDGAFGFSTGFEYSHSKGFSNREIFELVEIAAAKGKVFAAQLRNKAAGVLDSVSELIEVTRQTGVNLEINNLTPLKNAKDFYLEAKNAIEKETAQTHINFDCHPFEYSVLPIFEFLPEWLTDGGVEKIVEDISSSHLQKHLLEHFNVFKPEDIVIYDMPRPFKPLISKSLKEFAVNSHLKPAAALLKLMRITELMAVMLSRDIDSKSLEEFLCSPNAIISSDGFYSGGNFSAFRDFIKWTQAHSDFPFEKALAKITSIPAQKYKIRKRGLLKENYYADVVILRDFLPSEVLLNGKLVLEEMKMQKIYAGKALKCDQNN